MKAIPASGFFRCPMIVVTCVILGFGRFTTLAQTQPDQQTIEAFFNALHKNDTNTVFRMLDANTNLVHSLYYGKVPLTVAAGDGSVQIVNQLLKDGADVNVQNDTWNSGNLRLTALEAAIWRGNRDLCKSLLEAGANPDIQSAFDGSALHYAFSYHRNEMAEWLLDYGADPFLEKNNPYNKVTPFEMAITFSDGKLVPRMLGQRGPVRGALRPTRPLPWKKSAKANQRAAARLIAEKGASLLAAAAERGELEAVQALLRAGVSAKSDAPNGYTVLQAFALSAAEATKSRPAAIARWQQTSNEFANLTSNADSRFLASLRSRLAEQAAKVEASDPERLQQLRDLLIRKGAVYDAFAATALGDTNQAERLLSADKKVVLARDHNGETPLDWAVKTDQLPLTAFWIHAGVPLVATNSGGQTALHLAAAKGLVNQVKLLLAANAPTGIRDTNGLTPLDAAIQAKQPGCIHLLMAKAPATAYPGRGPTTTLHEAAASGNVAALASLLETQTNLEARNELGLTPLQVAVLHGHLAAAALLVDKGADVNVHDREGNTLLHEILLQNQLIIRDRPPTNWLARVGQDPTKELYLKYLTVGRDQQGPNPLLQAASFLLASGADAAATNNAGETPMQLITDGKTGRGVFFFDNERAELLQLLSAHGGNVNQRDTNGNAALHRLSSGYYDVSKVERMASLIASGADVNATNNLGQTPLHLAAGNITLWDDNNPPVNSPFQLLIYSKANVNAQDNNGLTPLDVVAASNSTFKVEATRFLLDAGANPNLPDKQGRTPIDFFLTGGFGHWAGSDGCIDMLVKAGANLSAKDNQGKTPLHYLAALGSSGSMFFFPKFEKDLLAAKVDLNARDNDGDTPLHIAARTGTHNVFDWLVKHGANLDATNNAGETPRQLAAHSTDRFGDFRSNSNVNIYQAIRDGKLDSVAAILKSDPDLLNKTNQYRQTPLLAAAQSRRTNIVDFLIKQGAHWDPVSAILVGRTDVLRKLMARQPRLAADDSLLRLAAANGNLSAAELLLASGADLKATDALGLSPLGDALWQHHHDLAGLLVQHGARKNIFDALFSGDAETVAALITRNKSLTFATNRYGLSVAEIAAAKGNEKILKLLLKRGVSPNYQNPRTGRSLLYDAAAYDQTNTAKLLIQRHAKLNAVDHLGLTPVQLCALRGSVGVLELLLKHKANCNARIAAPKNVPHHAVRAPMLPFYHLHMLQGNTALHLAVLTTQTNAIALLIKHGADVNATNSIGMTPLDFAQRLRLPQYSLMGRTGLRLPFEAPYFRRSNTMLCRNEAIALLKQAGGKHGELYGPNGRMPYYTMTAAPAVKDGRAYHDQGCREYNHHDFTNALADFRKSCALGSNVQDYSYYRIWLIRSRLGEEVEATRELKSYLEHRQEQKPEDWPLRIGLFLTGQLSEGNFLQAADNPNSQTSREQHCEAYFYAGSKRLIENDQATAVDYFKKCLATGQYNFEEYQSAEAELRFLRVPFIPIQNSAQH